MNHPASALVWLGMSENGATAVERTERPRRRRRTVAAVAVLAVVSAAILTWRAAAEVEPDDRMLVVDGEGAISLLDPVSGNAVFELPGAVATPDRSALLTTRATASDRTVLESHDPETGEVTGETTLDGVLSVRTVSPEGGAVALLPGPRPRALYEPEPREATPITVSYTDDRPSRSYDLPGNFEPEMFSLDETTLFVLEFQPASAPTGYLVRMLDLATGELTDSGAPEVELTRRMRGRARAQVLHPDGTFLYTLYTLPNTGEPVHDADADAEGDSARWAFIHVIHLEEKWSFCIFLPVPLGTGDEATIGMGITPDGSSLLVADPSTSTLARVDSQELTVEEVVHVERLRDNGTKAAVAIAGDGTVYLGSGGNLLELAADSLEPAAAWYQPDPISALAVSASGDELRVGGRDGITIIDRASRQETAVLSAPGRGTLSLLGPPRGSVTEFPLECAC